MAEVPDVLTVEEAAEVLRIGRTLVYQLAQEWIATGGEAGFPCRRIGRLLRVPSAELADYMGGPITWPPPTRNAPVEPESRRERPSPRPPRSSSKPPRTPRRCPAAIDAAFPDLSVMGPQHDSQHDHPGELRRTCTCRAVPGRPVSGSVGGRAVLSLGKLAPGQQQYYVDTVAGVRRSTTPAPRRRRVSGAAPPRRCSGWRGRSMPRRWRTSSTMWIRLASIG